VLPYEHEGIQNESQNAHACIVFERLPSGLEDEPCAVWLAPGGWGESWRSPGRGAEVWESKRSMAVRLCNRVKKSLG
jgi:hypothetical protein